MRFRVVSALSFGLVLAACGDSGNDTTFGGARTDPTRDAGSSNAPDATTEGTNDSGAATVPSLNLVLTFGDDVSSTVQDRIAKLVTDAAPLPVLRVAATSQPADVALASGSIVLSFGATGLGRALISDADAKTIPAEGYTYRTRVTDGVAILAERGTAGTKLAYGNSGNLYGAYAMLESLGFAFLHPLAPYKPTTLTLPTSTIDTTSSPHWPIRQWHVHTMHPIEMTEMLQGWGDGMPVSDSTFTERLPEWDLFLEWMLANGQNRVDWVILRSDKYPDFTKSPARAARLKTLVDHAHAYGLAAGIDASIALTQQLGFAFVQSSTSGDAGTSAGDAGASDAGATPQERQQIDDGIDYLFGGAGFDFLETESGTTEFTHPDSNQMLDWMNETASYTETKYGKPSYIKAHCSSGQTADGFLDPYSGQPLNFNFLPHYADPRMGVMPHTVEIYGLDDPAPTYGNTDFGYMRTFLQEEVGTREVLWHPETAYWVTYDINVPLFLPIYAERRVHDLRLLGGDESAGLMGRGAHAGGRMDGQANFSSGWEWGYWLNDVVTARAAWEPKLTATSDRDAFLADLAPVVRPFGHAAPDVAAWLADVADAEAALLIRGEVNGVAPSTIVERSGMAYLEGMDASYDLATDAAALGISAAPIFQPPKLGLVDLRNPLHGGPNYDNELGPLLGEMDATFAVLAQRADALLTQIPPAAADLFADLRDAMKMTSLRAAQVHGLYDYVDGYPNDPHKNRAQRLATARTSLDSAQAVVTAREAKYRVPADRIAAWRPNPTAYDFTYLWTVRSLYFWWRDEGKAVDAPITPCYLNIMNPVAIALGEGTAASIASIARQITDNDVTDCAAAPMSEPKFPQNNLRSRP